MDKVKKYEQIISSFLTEYAKDAKLSTTNEVTPRLLMDTLRHSYQFLYIGWQGSRYVFSPIFHFDIIDDKIWIQRNNTELEIDNILIEQGVDSQDIVLGFQPSYIRERLIAAY